MESQDSFQARQVDEHLAEWARGQAEGSASYDLNPPIAPKSWPGPWQHREHFSEVIGADPKDPSKLQLAIGVIAPLMLIIATIITLADPSITGLVTYSEQAQIELNSTITSSRNITIELNDVPTSVRINGRTTGDVSIIHQPSGLIVFRTADQGNTTLTDACAQTCAKLDYSSASDPPRHNLTLEIAIGEGSELDMRSIGYTFTHSNRQPLFNRKLANLTIPAETSTTIDLLGYAKDPDNDSITFIATNSMRADIEVHGSILQIIPKNNATGSTGFVVYASDTKSISRVTVNLDIRRDIGTDEAAAMNAPFEIEPDLVEQTQLEDGTPVIIELEEPQEALGDGIKAAKIKEEQIALDTKTSDDGVSLKRRYANIPAVSAVMTREGLQDLMSNPNIKAIRADEEFSVSITDELRMVHAEPAARIMPDGTRLDGEGKTVCLIDTGVQTGHPDLSGKAIGGYNSIYSPAYSSTDIEDDNGHGTAVAGIIVAPDGIAPMAKIFPVKACDKTGACMASAILSAIDACIGARSSYNITVISGSFGDGLGHTAADCPDTLGAAITAAHDAGLTMTFAAGNNGYFDGVNYPACDGRAISVGSSTLLDTPASFTNKGTKLDILAPGQNVTTAMIGGGRGATSGTSISTPFAAGAAIVIAQALELTGQEATPEEVKSLLMNNSAKVMGMPRLDLSAAIDAATGKSETPMPENGTRASPAGNGTQAIKPTHSFTPASGKSSALVTRQIEREGKADVIIELELPNVTMKDGFAVMSLNQGRAMTKAELKDAVGRAQRSSLEWLRTTQRGAFGTLSSDEDLSIADQPEYLPFITGTVSASGLEKLKSSRSVKAIHPNIIRELLPTMIDQEPKASFDISLPTIGAVYARDTLNYTGLGVKIAIIDSGVDYTHPDLGGCTRDQFLAGTCAKVPIGYAFCNATNCGRDADPIDQFGHGSHVAGIIGGTGVGGLKGIAPNATFIAIKSCNATGSCPDSSVIAGIDYAISHGADVITMSLGSVPIPNDGLDVIGQAASAAALMYRITVVAAAGNSGPGTGSVATPAAGPGVLSVAASNDAGTAIVNDDTIASFSDRGPFAFGRFGPDISAPGVGINSTVPQTSQCAYSTALCSNTGYKVSSGTSFATPHVTGVVALLREQDKNLTPAEIRSILMSSAVNISGHPFDKGAGLINATGALTRATRMLIDGAEKGRLEAIAGEYDEFNITIVNKGIASRTITLSADNISEPDGNNSIAASWDLPLPFTAPGNSDTTVRLRVKTNSGATPSVYGGTIAATSDLGETMRSPFTLTVPLYGDGTISMRTSDTSSSSKTGDIFYFKLISPNASGFTTYMSWPDSQYDMDMYLFSEGGLLLTYSAGLDDPEWVGASNVYEKTYWVAANSYYVPSSGMSFDVATAYNSNLTITPNSIQASAIAGQTKQMTFAIRNSLGPKNMTVALTRLQDSESVDTARTAPAGGYDYYSFTRNGLNMSGMKTCDVSINWTGDTDLDLSYYTSNDGGTTNTTRLPQSSHDNGQLNQTSESLIAHDVGFMAGYYREWGIKTYNKNNSAAQYNLSVRCKSNKPAPEAGAAPSYINTINNSQELNVTVTVDTAAIQPNSSIDYILMARYNDTREWAKAAVTLTVAAAPGARASNGAYDGATTNLSSVADITNIPDMTLEKTALGRIRWNGQIDARDANFTRYSTISAGLIAVNASVLHRSINSSVNITFYGASCAGYKLLTAGGYITDKEETIESGYLCNSTSDPTCSNVACDDNTLTFQVGRPVTFALLNGIANSIITTSRIGESNLTDANVTNSRVNSSEVTLSNIKNASLTGSAVNRTTIDNSTFSKSNATDSTINISSVNNSDVLNSTLIEVIMKDSVAAWSYIDPSNITNSTVNNSFVEDSELDNSSIYDSNATNSTVNASLLSQADVRNSTIKGSTIHNTSINNSRIENSTISNGINISCGQTITGDINLSFNVVGHNPCYNVGADSIAINCNGYTVTGTGSAPVINITGRAGVNVANCNIFGDNTTAITRSNSSSITNISAGQGTIIISGISLNNTIQRAANISAITLGDDASYNRMNNISASTLTVSGNWNNITNSSVNPTATVSGANNTITGSSLQSGGNIITISGSGHLIANNTISGNIAAGLLSSTRISDNNMTNACIGSVAAVPRNDITISGNRMLACTGGAIAINFEPAQDTNFTIQNNQILSSDNPLNLVGGNDWKILGNTFNYSGQIILTSSNGTLFANNTVNSPINAVAIDISNLTYSSIRESTIANGSAGSIGIRLRSSIENGTMKNLGIDNNTIEGFAKCVSTATGEDYPERLNGTSIYGNKFHSCGIAIEIEANATGASAGGMRVLHNRVTSTSTAIKLRSASGARIENNAFNATGNTSILLIDNLNATMINTTITGALNGISIINTSGIIARYLQIYNATSCAVLLNRSNGGILTNLTINSTSSSIHVTGGLNHTINETYAPHPVILENASYSIINFTAQVNFTAQLPISSMVNLSNNYITVNSTLAPQFNISAILTSYVSFSEAAPGIDPEDDGTFNTCPLTRCAAISQAGSAFVFNVTGFTSYGGISPITGSVIVNSTINGSIVQNSTVTNSTVTNSTINRSVITNSTVYNSTASNSSIINSILGNSTLTNSTFTGSYANSSQMLITQILNSTIISSMINRTNVENSSMRFSNITSSIINDSSIENSSVSTSNLTASIVNLSIISGSLLSNGSAYSSNISDSISDNSTIHNSNLSLSNANASNIDLSGLSNTTAYASRVNTSSTTNTTLIRTNLTLANISLATLKNSSAQNSTIIYSRVTSSTLLNSTASNSTITVSGIVTSLTDNSTQWSTNLTRSLMNASVSENSRMTNTTSMASDVNSTTADNTTMANSRIEQSTINTTRMYDSTLGNSSAIRCVINLSQAYNSTLANSTILLATINLSALDNSSAWQSNVTDSTLNKSMSDTSSAYMSMIVNAQLNNTVSDNSTAFNISSTNSTINSSIAANLTLIESTLMSANLNRTYAHNITAANSTIKTSVINNSRAENSTIIGSNQTWSDVNNSNVHNSTIYRANVTASIVAGSMAVNSSINQSDIVNCNLTNVTVHNSTLSGETIANDIIINSRSLAACGKVIGRDTIMTQNITCAGAAFIFNISNHGLSCQGFLIQGNGTSTAIGIRSQPNSSADSCIITNYSIAISVNDTNGASLTNMRLDSNRIGLLISNSSNITIGNMTSTRSALAGALIDPSDNITIENSTFAGGVSPIVLLDANNSRIAFNLIENSTGGLNLTNSFNNRIHNNTLRNNSVNIRLTSGMGNLIYDNFISDAKSLHISAGAGNTFNTSGTSGGHGNLFDNTIALRIYDQNGDGYGERGWDWPYNSTNNGTVNINVTDWGPITSRQDQAPAQVGAFNAVDMFSGGTYNQIDLDGVFTDPDGDPLNYTVSGNNSLGVTVDAATHIVYISAPGNFTGTQIVTFIANDSILAASAGLTINVAAAPPPPTSQGSQGSGLAGPSAESTAGADAAAAAAAASAAATAAPASTAAAPAPAAAAAPAPPSSVFAPTVTKESFRNMIEGIKKTEETAVACGYRTKKTIKKEVVPTKTTLTQVKLPEGYKTATDPFTLSCDGDSLDLTLNVPAGFTDLKALRCKKDGCTNIIEKEVTTKELVCGGKTVTQIRKEEITQRKESLELEDLGVITEEGTTIANAKRAIQSGKNRLEFTRDIRVPFQAKISSPKSSVPSPKNPSAAIIGTPLEVTLRNAQGPLAARITLPYIKPENYDPDSFAIFARTDGEWEYLEGSARDENSQKISVETDDILKYSQNGVAQFAVIGTGCAACQQSKLAHTYAPEGARTAIILLHGFASSPKTWQFLIDEIALTNQLYQIYTFEFSASRPVMTTTREFMDQMELESGQFDTVYIVAHSLGGLITQEALHQSELAGAKYTWLPKVKKVVLIGTPNDGTPGVDVFQNLFQSLVNEKSVFNLFNFNSQVMGELSKGMQVQRTPGIKYYAIAGTKPYEFNLGAFTVSTKELFKLMLPNDGITTTESAQHVGGQYINDSCKNYYQINLTHTELVDNPLSRRVIERIIGEDQYKQTGTAIGYNQYLRLQIEQCDPEEQIVIIGKPIKPEAEPAPLGCNCGNGVCGVDETPETCPQDCSAKIERPAQEIATEAAVYLVSTLVLLFILYRAWRMLKRRKTKGVYATEEPYRPTEERVQIIGAAGVEEMAAPPERPKPYGYDTLPAHEKLKIDLADLEEDLDRVLEAKPKRPIFYPLELKKEIDSIKKKLEVRLPEKRGRSNEEAPVPSAIETSEIRKRIEELRIQYPLAGKKKGDKKTEEGAVAGQTIEGAPQLGDAIKRGLKSIGEEISRMLNGRTPHAVEEEKSEEIREEKTETPAPRPKKRRSEPKPPEEPASKRLGWKENERERLLHLLEESRNQTRRVSAAKQSRRDEEITRREPPKISSMIKGELDDLFEDTKQLIDGAILRTKEKRDSQLEGWKREKAIEIKEAKPARERRPEPAKAPKPAMRPIQQPKPAAAKEIPKKKTSSVFGAELSGIVEEAERFLGMDDKSSRKAEDSQKTKRKTEKK